MYTVIVGFDNLVEVYQLKKYNQEIKEAIECISTYGEDSVEFVCEGEIVETMHEIVSLTEMVKRFDENEFFQTFYQKEDKGMIDHYKRLLEEVAVK